MEKIQRLRFEIYVGDLLEELKVKNSEQLYKIQEELEECLGNAILDYAEFNNWEVIK